MSSAMILGAGYGTRLRPLTDWLAKPMVPVGDGPMAQHIVKRLRDGGIERLVVNVHHRPEDLRSWATAIGATISEETELLGTAGGVARAETLLGNGDVLVWNGDIFVDLDPRALLETHRASGAEATLAVVPRPARTGNVGLGRGGRIVRLRHESFGEELRGADFVGVQVLGVRSRARLPKQGCLVGDVHIPALRAGLHLASHPLTTPFIDVGSLAHYVAANRAWLAERRTSSWLAMDARASASTEGSIVGARARVDADAIRCVVWPDTHVRERIEDAIVTPQGVVAIPDAQR